MVLDKLVVNEWSPGASVDQLLYRLDIARAESIVSPQMLLAHSEDDEAAGAQRVQHVFEGARWQQVGPEATRTRDNIEGAPETFRQSLLANNERLYVLVDASAHKRLFLSVGAFLAEDLGEALVDEQLAKLAPSRAEVQDLRIEKGLRL